MADKAKTKAAPSSTVQRADGRGSVTRVGIASHRAGDLYHFLLTTSWPALLGLIAVYYLLVNALFAVAYWLGDGGIAQARPGSLTDAFFFSVQTFATIGYGAMAPQSLYAHLLVTLESFVGIMSVAITTGLMFAKFARPTARVLFSNVAVVAMRDGQPALMVRMANERSNMIVEATVRVTVLLTEKTKEGETLRRLHDLDLIRSNTPAFTLTFTAVHPIGEKSPLRGMDAQTLAAQDAQIIVSISGMDDTFAQTVHARRGYKPEEVVFGARFVDILATLRDGGSVVDYTKFNDWVPETPAQTDRAAG